MRFRFVQFAVSFLTTWLSTTSGVICREPRAWTKLQRIGKLSQVTMTESRGPRHCPPPVRAHRQDAVFVGFPLSSTTGWTSTCAPDAEHTRLPKAGRNGRRASEADHAEVVAISNSCPAPSRFVGSEVLLSPLRRHSNRSGAPATKAGMMKAPLGAGGGAGSQGALRVVQDDKAERPTRCSASP